MRTFLIGRIIPLGMLLVLMPWPARSQLISLGIKGGVPLADSLETGPGGSGSISHERSHYLVGPTGELHLPFGLSFEVDALYRPLNYTVDPQSLRATAFTGSD